MRRVIVTVTVTMTMLLLAATSARGQCQGYTAANPQQTLLTPAQVAAQGGVTATVTMTPNVSGANPSHNVIVTPGTVIYWTWASNNGSTATAYYTVNNGTTHYEFNSIAQVMSLSGNSYMWTMGTGDIGIVYQIFYVVTGANGQSQDHLTIQTQSGNGASVVAQDNIDTNVYAQISSTFGGPPMMHACTICTQNPGYCANRQHTPLFSGTLTNHGSNEVQTITQKTAGAVVNENTPISGSGSIWISALPGDEIDGSVNDEIDCSVLGGIFKPIQLFRVEYARTILADLGHMGRPLNDGNGTVQFDVAAICQNNCDPPDWNPTKLDTTIGRHQWWMGVTACMRFPDLSGVPWQCLADIVTYMPSWFNQNPILLLAAGAARPYNTGTFPYFTEPVPGECTKYPTNVILTWAPGITW